MTVTLIDTARNGKLLKRFTAATVLALTKMDVRKHQNAVMSVFHAAEYGECSSLNTFFNALKVNDQTALKAWIVKHFSYEVEGGTVPFQWIDFTTKKNGVGEVIGFHVIKGREDKRKDVYSFDELMALEPFYAIDLSKPKTWDLNALLDIVIKAGTQIKAKSEKGNITLPAGFAAALEDAVKQAVLHHIDEAAETVANENVTTEIVVDKPEEIVADKYLPRAVKAA
jgi:hypothetical protein